MNVQTQQREQAASLKSQEKEYCRLLEQRQRKMQEKIVKWTVILVFMLVALVMCGMFSH